MSFVPVPALPVSHDLAFFALVIGFRCVNGTERNNKKQISKKLPIFFSCDKCCRPFFGFFFLGNCPEKVGVCCVGGAEKCSTNWRGRIFYLVGTMLELPRSRLRHYHGRSILYSWLVQYSILGKRHRYQYNFSVLTTRALQLLPLSNNLSI